VPDDDKPLISKDSPSLRRARDEWKNPAPTADPEVIAALSRIVEAEHVAAAVCRAIDRGDDADRHQRRAESVSAIVSELGGAAPSASEADPRSLPVSADEISYLSGDQLVAALERDEKAVVATYESAVGTVGDEVAGRLEAIRG
jgi:hypothetical protein